MKTPKKTPSIAEQRRQLQELRSAQAATKKQRDRDPGKARPKKAKK
jgi:hypothetical protein